MHPLGPDQRGNPSESKPWLVIQPLCVFSFCQHRYEVVICLAPPTNPGHSACGGNSNTPLDAVAAVSLQKCYKPWTGSARRPFRNQPLTCHPAVVFFSYCQHRYKVVICLPPPPNPGQSPCGGNLNTPWGCRNATTLALSSSGYAFERRTVARSFESSSKKVK